MLTSEIREKLVQSSFSTNGIMVSHFRSHARLMSDETVFLAGEGWVEGGGGGKYCVKVL